MDTTIRVPLVNGKGYALIDAVDLPLVADHSWRLFKNHRGQHKITCYAATGRNTRFMHQLITGVLGADHVNGDGLDNRRINRGGAGSVGFPSPALTFREVHTASASGSCTSIDSGVVVVRSAISFRHASPSWYLGSTFTSNLLLCITWDAKHRICVKISSFQKLDDIARKLASR